MKNGPELKFVKFMTKWACPKNEKWTPNTRMTKLNKSGMGPIFGPFLNEPGLDKLWPHP